jgi:hypothetical protein
MYSWKTIRTVAALLLLLPLLHLVLLLSRETLATLDADPAAWAHEVAAFHRLDQGNTLPEAPIVVVGDRSVNRWPGLEQLLAPVPVLLRGIGRATVNDIAHFYMSLIGYYHPSGVVIVPGSSEFHVRDNKTAEELVAGIDLLARVILSHEMTRHLYVFAPLKLPRYPGDAAKVEASLRLLREWAAGDPRIRVLDANRLLSDLEGAPMPYYFHSDGSGLNEHGYLRLTLLLREQVERDYGEIFAARE